MVCEMWNLSQSGRQREDPNFLGLYVTALTSSKVCPSVHTTEFVAPLCTYLSSICACEHTDVWPQQIRDAHPLLFQCWPSFETTKTTMGQRLLSAGRSRTYEWDIFRPRAAPPLSLIHQKFTMQPTSYILTR